MKLIKIPFTIVGFMTDTEWDGIVRTRNSTQYWVKDKFIGFNESEYEKTFYI